MSVQESIASRVQQLRWFHSIDLGNGIVTPGSKTQERHRIEAAAFFDPIDLTGKTVLDIGAWNGFYSFEAERRGAARVVASDHHCWQPNIQGRISFDLAKNALGSKVTPLDIDAMDIAPETVGTFDVVLFLGVFYHLKDPIEGLRRAASVCKGMLVVETQLDMMADPLPAMRYYPTTELGGDATNWWGPNAACVIALMQGCGFSVTWQNMPGDNARGVFHGTRIAANG